MGIDIVEFRQLREVGVFFYLDILCLKSNENGFGCCEAGMAMDFGSKKVEPMLDEGVVHGQPTYCFGTAKKSGLMVGLKFVHVFCCMLLLELNDLKCVWEMIC